MAKSQSWNPIAFRKTQVTVIGCALYLASLVAVLVIHLTVPPAPSSSSSPPADGVNLTQAWLDLKELTNGYHPWNSRRNDEVQTWLKSRIADILQANHVDYAVVHDTSNGFISKPASPKNVTLFANDSSTAITLDDAWGQPSSLYSESQNILVYIRGTEDKQGNWWNETASHDESGGVLVSAHYDSVSSGYGATDDGTGVVTILQLISHFTTPGNRPTRGIVALLNNGEEDGLHGARTFVRHPLSRFTRTFLNLEGAGAGGRALLLRSTDAGVTRAYANSPHPFGSVVTADGFKSGMVRSETDYAVFTKELGLRGLDLTFYEPRARYHTDQDDVRDTSVESLWQMLESALATVTALTSTAEEEVSDAVYFDMFGRALAVLKLHDLFALSVTLLVVGPVLLIVLEVLLRRNNKWYLFGHKQYLHSTDDDELARLHGRRGFFRFPVAFVLAEGVVFSLAYLVTKINPYIAYSSQYTVWAMLLSVYVAVAWFILAGAANLRPTALHRMFVLIWLYALSWLALVAATVGENNFGMGGGYFTLIYNASAFVALLISYIELSVLPTTKKYTESVLGVGPDSGSNRAPSRAQSIRDLPITDAEEPDERTSLLGRRRRAGSNTNSGSIRRQRFAPADAVPEDDEDDLRPQPYPEEQPWSSHLPQWTWILQYLVLIPVNVILVGQIALVVMSALNQTLTDGAVVLTIYLLLAALASLLLLPFTPFLHRVTHQVPTFLFLVFIGCLIYNLLAFPFSRDARMHFFFKQSVDLNTGANNATIRAMDGYVQQIIGELPSAAGRPVDCEEASGIGQTICSFNGIPPYVVPAHDQVSSFISTDVVDSTMKKPPTANWLSFNVTSTSRTATFTIRGLNTKICRLTFDQAVAAIHVEGSAPPHPNIPAVPKGGSTRLDLLSRSWDKTFRVNVTWPAADRDDGTGVATAKGQKGRVYCLWDDVNIPSVIPAWDEVVRFAPVWAAPTKAQTGLVEGWKEFVV